MQTNLQFKILICFLEDLIGTVSAAQLVECGAPVEGIANYKVKQCIMSFLESLQCIA